jgi:hypothetical protein
MSLVASAKGGDKQLQLAPAGTHIARCVQVIDYGTQKGEWQGKPKISHKARIAWELPTEKAIFGEGKGEEPFVVGTKYTVSLSERARLRADLESWRGRPFTAAELEKFDISKLLGAPCMVTIIHEPSKDGTKTYAKVKSVTAMPKGIPCPDQITKSTHFELEMGRESEAFKGLPEWMQKDILMCVEWAGASAPIPRT